MPPKRKESAAAPAASGPKQKWSKTSFQTPMTAALESTTTSSASELGSTSTSSKNQVITLRSSASGCCGYRSQDLSTTQSSSLDALAAEKSPTSSDIINNIADTNPPLDLESDTQPDSGAKSRPKQKNITTVSYTGYGWHFANESLDKT